MLRLTVKGRGYLRALNKALEERVELFGFGVSSDAITESLLNTIAVLEFADTGEISGRVLKSFSRLRGMVDDGYVELVD
jgi:hypothetical protein